jgi:hypothetical protein
MNGREITSWGCKPEEEPHSVITKALFDPGHEWNYLDENGKAFKRCGLERRAFFFNPKEPNSSAACDGGLIELRVYRAKGRHRRIQEPVVYKNQEKYGIA